MGKSVVQNETAVLCMSDLHYGKKTGTFNASVFPERLGLVADNIARIKECMRGYSFDKLVVFLLGDIGDGTGIYPTQNHHQDETNAEEQAEQLTEILAPWLEKQKKLWGQVQVEAVPGNHGRSGRFSSEAASWDVVTYKYLRNRLAGSIPLHLSKRNLFLRKVEIRKHHYLLYHGHDIKTYGQIPWYGMMNRLSRWNTTHLAPFDVAVMGHFHSFGHWVLNKLQLLLNGTMITDDDWALQTLGWESANKWWLFGVSDKRPITWKFGLDLA